MKKLDSRNAAKRSQKHLVLSRETLRRLDGNDMAQVVGGASVAPDCTLTTKQPVVISP